MRFVKSEKDEVITTGKDEEKVELTDFEYPQYDSIEEFVTAAGDEKTALEYVNGHAEKDAKNVGRVALRDDAVKANKEVAFAKIRDLIRNWSPKGGEDGRKVNKKKAAAFDQAEVLLNSADLTIEQKMAKLAELLAAAK